MLFESKKQAIGRSRLETLVASEIRSYSRPGELLKELSNWPFAGYVTTNYDTLIRRALQAIGQDGGWTEAGNSDSEIRKLSGDTDHLIWHLHGAVDHPDNITGWS